MHRTTTPATRGDPRSPTCAGPCADGRSDRGPERGEHMTRRITWGLLSVSLALVPAPARAESLLEGIVDVLGRRGELLRLGEGGDPRISRGNGSQYKFFVRRTSSPDLLFFFEGGGACWDYDTCSGRTGGLGAANPNGIADDYMQLFTAKYVSPIVNGADPGMPFRSRTDLITKNWNIVYLPYCTGDVHIGDRSRRTSDPQGSEPPLHVVPPRVPEHGRRDRMGAPGVPEHQIACWSPASAPAGPGPLPRTGSCATPSTRRGLPSERLGTSYFSARYSTLSQPMHDTIARGLGADSVVSQIPGTLYRDLGSVNLADRRPVPDGPAGVHGVQPGLQLLAVLLRTLLPRNQQGFGARALEGGRAALPPRPRNTEQLELLRSLAAAINDSHCSTIITFIGSHACQRMEKKHHWWEYFDWPPASATSATASSSGWTASSGVHRAGPSRSASRNPRTATTPKIPE